MISDDDIEKALDFMRNNATKAAQARADRAYLEEFRKVLKGQIMRENSHLALGAQEAAAYADERYMAHLKGYKDAVFEDERLRFMFAAAEAKVQAWQTQSANNRKGI
jgi:hypothetical protein